MATDEITLSAEDQEIFDDCCALIDDDLSRDAVVGVLGLPPFLIALLRRYAVGAAAPLLLAEVVRAVLREKVAKGAGKTLPPGHVEALTELKARGGRWKTVAELLGPAGPNE